MSPAGSLPAGGARGPRVTIRLLASTSIVRVGFVIGSLDVGGTERQLVELAARLDRRRFEARVFCLSHQGAQADGLRERGIAVTSFGVGAVPLAKWAVWTWRLRRLFAAAQLDVVHGFLFPSYALAGFAANGTATRVIAGIRAVGVGREGDWPFSRIDGAGLARAQQIVVNAEAVRTAVQRRHPGIAAKIRVIPNGIDSDSYRVAGDRDLLRASLGLPRTGFVAMMVANLIPYKGHEDALHALARLRLRVPRAVLALVGAGPREARLRSLAGELGLADAVFFLGQRADIPKLWAAADVALLASWEEGLPNAVLEAMAASRPVVATRVGGVPELIEHELTGLLVEARDSAGMADALERIACDSALAERLALAARARVRDRFGWDRVVSAHQELFAAIASRDPDTSR